mgnify:CR=1 FL=1
MNLDFDSVPEEVKMDSALSLSNLVLILLDENVEINSKGSLSYSFVSKETRRTMFLKYYILCKIIEILLRSIQFCSKTSTIVYLFWAQLETSH